MSHFTKKVVWMVGVVISAVVMSVSASGYIYQFKDGECVKKYDAEDVDSFAFGVNMKISFEKLVINASVDSLSLGFSCTPKNEIDASDVVWSSSDNTVATVKNGIVYPVSEGECTIIGTYGISKVSCVVTVDNSLKNNLGYTISKEYEWVDMGLPSGTKWAKHNIGALFPDDCGDSFRWGEVTPIEKLEELENKEYTLNNVCADLYRKQVIGIDYNLTPQYDAATVNWGNKWKIPTEKQCKELVANCIVENAININGVSITKYISKINRNVLLLPDLPYKYWGATPFETTKDLDKGCEFLGNAKYVNTISGEILERQEPGFVRPVLKNENDSITETIYAHPLPDNDIHCAVDMGFPSGTLWASTNIGAVRPECYGLYFGWGEVTPKDSCTKENCKFYGMQSDELRMIGVIDTANNLVKEYDAASTYWLNNTGIFYKYERWCIPTQQQVQELIDNSDIMDMEMKGVKGRKFTSKINGKSIFLPYCGYMWASSLTNEGFSGEYWSSTLGLYYDNWYAVKMAFNKYNPDIVGIWHSSMEYACPIRPVLIRKK